MITTRIQPVPECLDKSLLRRELGNLVYDQHTQQLYYDIHSFTADAFMMLVDISGAVRAQLKAEVL